MRILAIVVLIFGGLSAVKAEGLPCIVAATDSAGTVALMPGEGTLCPGRAVEMDSTGGAIWHRVGLLLQKEQTGFWVATQAIIDPGVPQPTAKWVDVEFREAKFQLGGSVLQRQAPWVGLIAGAYRVIVSVFDQHGHDYLSAVRFNVAPLEARDEPYLRAGWTEMPDGATMRFGSLLGNASATGFMYQEYSEPVFGGQETPTTTRLVVAGVSFAEVGKLGDVRLIQAALTFSRWGEESFSPAHAITACVQPDGIAETFCGVVYDPAFPNRGDWRTTK